MPKSLIVAFSIKPICAGIAIKSEEALQIKLLLIDSGDREVTFLRGTARTTSRLLLGDFFRL
jgi:hypothetical protein